MSLRAPRLNPVKWGLLAAAAVVAALGVESTGGPEMPERAGDLAAGLALTGCGAVAWTRRPRAGAGSLMLLSGLAWFAGDLSSALLYAHRGPLVHLLLTYPSGRTSSRVTIIVIAAAYVDGLSPAGQHLGGVRPGLHVGEAQPISVDRDAGKLAVIVAWHIVRKEQAEEYASLMADWVTGGYREATARGPTAAVMSAATDGGKDELQQWL